MHEIKRLQRKRAATQKKRGTQQTQREWICISFGISQGTNELPHRLPPNPSPPRPAVSLLQRIG